MSWKTQIASSLLASVGNIKLATLPDKNSLLILAYHRIIPDHMHFLFDRGVISASPSLFEEQIKFLKARFTFLSFSSLKMHLKAKTQFTKPPVIITFDDGYLDNYTYAYPILKKHGACGTIFLTVGYIGTNRIFWWDELAFSLHHTKEHKLSFKANNAEHSFTFTNKEKTIVDVLKVLKRVADEERITLLEEIKNKLRINISDYRFDRQILNWDEVRKMANDNIEFGSHTITHPILANVPEVSRLQFELKESKQKIEKETNKETCVFSYPVGRPESINGQVIAQVKEAGYDFATTYQHGINALNKGIDLFYLKRLDIDHYPLEKFKAKVAFPGLFKR